MMSVEFFEQQRAKLFAIAYRMLGSVSDAEDLVQETFLRWQQAQPKTVQAPEAYLATITTRLCIDHLRRARIQREHYIGCWLPEPFAHSTNNPIDLVELSDSLSIAFLVLLEQLSPTERAIFLLREVFSYDYSAISNMTGKSPANCRQIMHRVRQRITHSTPETFRSQQEISKVEQFLDAWTTGNLKQLIALMTDDITYVSDGGGKASATHKPLHGQQKVARFLIAIRRSSQLRQLSHFTSKLGTINYQPSIINYANGIPHSVMTFDWSKAGYIQNIFTIINPDKLQHVC